MKDERYLEIPGTMTLELPPLLVRGPGGQDGEPAGGIESVMSEAEDMLPPSGADPAIVDQRRFDLALQLSAQYRGLVSHWLWGDSVLEWIRQCEITFESEAPLRRLLHPDVWPHAGRASFVQLLLEKEVQTHGVALERAVGMRLTFRQPPPIACFSNQFLLFLNSPMADAAYQTWAHLAATAPVLFPPERFHFEVLDVGSIN